MAEIAWTGEALRWLEDIFEYIADDNPQAAAQTVQGIYDRAQELPRFPEIGFRYPTSPRHVRIILYGHLEVGIFEVLVKAPRRCINLPACTS